MLHVVIGADRGQPYFLASPLRPASLFPASVAARLGISSVSIGQGSEAFPVATAGATAGWAPTEGGNVPNETLYQRLAEARWNQTLGAHVRITRKTLKQSGAGLEQAIGRDMNAAVGAELDRAILLCFSTTGAPLGLISGAGIYGNTSTNMTAAAPSWTAFKIAVVAFRTANAITDASQV